MHRFLSDFSRSVCIGNLDISLVLKEGNLGTAAKGCLELGPLGQRQQVEVFARFEVFSQPHVLPVVKHITPVRRVCVVEHTLELLLVLTMQLTKKEAAHTALQSHANHAGENLQQVEVKNGRRTQDILMEGRIKIVKKKSGASVPTDLAESESDDAS